MRLLDRYLLRELFIPLGYCLGGFLIFYIAFDLIASLTRFQEHDLRVGDVAELYVVKLPAILVFILPIALLLALLYTLTNHARHHELTAMRAAGVSLWRICIPYLAVGILLSLIAFALNELWVPDSEAKQEQIMARRTGGSAEDADVQTNLGFPPSARNRRNWIIGSYNFKTDVMLNPQVDWQQHGTNWLLRSESAERINGVWMFFGATQFGTNDIIGLESLAARLKHPARKDGVSQFLGERLSPETQSLLAKYSGGTNEELRAALVADINRVAQGGPVYESARFAAVKLPPDILERILKSPRGPELVQLNRALLAAAYPQELSKNSLYTVNVWEGDAESNFRMLPFVNTNVLAMPEFTETRREFANEAKFNRRFSGKHATDWEDIPIADILAYQRLHPVLTPKNRWELDTQLNRRFAEPWCSLVVVMVAIPFGAASGRRNVFVGVASSIVICFVYFILLKLALALGTGGFLPGWAAAWLPNAIFGITGFWLMLRVR